jgi:hypothetical protein
MKRLAIAILLAAALGAAGCRAYEPAPAPATYYCVPRSYCQPCPQNCVPVQCQPCQPAQTVSPGTTVRTGTSYVPPNQLPPPRNP